MSIVPRIRLITMAAVGLTLAGGIVPAQAMAQTRQPTQSSASERKICVLEESTGRRIMRKVCRTRAQWERLGGLPTAN